MTFGDWGGDGVTDLVYTNYNYINIVNGTDGRLLWHYEGTGRLWGLSVDNYALPTGPEDIAYTGLYSFHIVSGNLIPPMAPAIPSSPPPLVASGAELTWLNLIPWAISILALGIISTIMYKKRKYLIFGRSAVRTVNY